MRKYTFRRWFHHWCAFNMVALSANYWKPKHLLHDLDKPILNLIFSTDTVCKYHRTHSDHHTRYKGNIDYISMVLDWESARFTKPESPLNAKETYLAYFKHRPDKKKIEEALRILEL